MPFFIIAGPTAADKSALAVAVAERCGGEIVSADAFQIYEGLDLLTAKPSAELQARVPHHLVGEIPVSQAFDVAQFLHLASARIEAIHARGRVPIVVGGTGLYLRALTHGLAELPPADPALRSRLETHSTAELSHQLHELDPAAHGQIDLQNRRRLIRALEVCLLTRRPFSSFREQWNTPPQAGGGIVLHRSRDELRDRIERRTEAMFSAGVMEEVRASSELGPTASQVLGWREIRELIAGTSSYGECVAAVQQATRRYAKRQLTWFRRERQLRFVEISGPGNAPDLIEALAREATVACAGEVR